MSLTIYLCRHGESEYNTENRLGGDSGLTIRGMEQARRIGNFLKDKGIAVMYYSPLKRSMQTADIFRDFLPDTSFISVPELSEIRYGCLDGLTVQQVKKLFPEEIALRKGDKYNWKLLDGESYADLETRTRAFSEELRKKEGTFGIISHKAINRIFLLSFVNPSRRKQVLRRDMSHCSVFKLNFDYQQLYEYNFDTGFRKISI